MVGENLPQLIGTLKLMLRVMNPEQKKHFLIMLMALVKDIQEELKK